jgi:hypothetical protein
MYQLFSTTDVTTKAGMAQLEETVAALLKGERGKCAFVRSEAFVKLRIRALYRREQDPLARPLSAETDGVKVTLTPAGTALVYIACPDAEPPEDAHDAALGKRKERPCDEPFAAT